MNSLISWLKQKLCKHGDARKAPILGEPDIDYCLAYWWYGYFSMEVKKRGLVFPSGFDPLPVHGKPGNEHSTVDADLECGLQARLALNSAQEDCMVKLSGLAKGGCTDQLIEPTNGEAVFHIQMPARGIAFGMPGRMRWRPPYQRLAQRGTND